MVTTKERTSLDIARGTLNSALPVPARTVRGTVTRTVRIMGTTLGVLGVVAIANAVTAGAVNALFGLVPRTSSGALGILLHPFVHANASHLAMNAIGLTLLGGLVLLRNERDFWRVTMLGMLVGGGATWLLGRTALHIGASGIVFAYLGYLLATGWFDRKLGSIALSVSVAIVWGSALLGLSPLQQGISWELHAFGLLGGIIGAWWRKKSSGSAK